MKIGIQKRKNIKEKILVTEAIIETEAGNKGFLYPKTLKHHLETVLQNRKLFIQGGILVIASMAANVLNYVFNTYAARVLSFSDFSLIGLVGAFLSLASILFGAYTFAINYSSSFLIGKYGNGMAYNFWRQMSGKAFIPSFLITALWLLISPLLMNYFHVNTIYLFLLFGFVLLLGLNNSINQGFLSAKLLFGSLAVLSVIDPIIRLSVTYGLFGAGQGAWAFVSMIISFVIVTIVSFILIAALVKKEGIDKSFLAKDHFSRKLFFLAIISSFSSVAYFTFDILLAKHFLAPSQAGQYVLISLIGKMVFFLGNLTAPFITPIVSRYEGAGKNSLKPLYVLLSITTFFSFFAFLLFGVFGHTTLPLLYGEKAIIILPYIPLFTFGMACYTISGVLVNYYLIKKVYSFTIITSCLVVLQVVLISLFHDSVGSIATVMSLVLIANLIVTAILHIAFENVNKLEKKFSFVKFFFIKKNLFHNIKTVAIESSK